MNASPEPSCMDDFDPNSLTVEQAAERIANAMPVLAEHESLALRDTLGRVLARDVISRFSVPAHANSAMDGFAYRHAEPTGNDTLTLAGESFAGRPFSGRVGAGECVRIMTGAVIPEDCDTVVIQENVSADGNTVQVHKWPRAGDNVRAAGEDIAEGATVLNAGRRISVPDLGLLASLGITELRVVRKPRVAFFSTGDELRSLGEPLGPGDIYDSNRYTLFGMLSEAGADIIDLGVVPDDRQATREAFAQAAKIADVVITSGGVSVGEADFVKETLAELGEVNFWKIAIKPGRPLAFGQVGEAMFFGLPGNPVSVMVTFRQFVRPALERMSGAIAAPLPRLRVACASRLSKRSGRVEYQRGILEQDAHGALLVRSTGAQGSGILTSMSQANCFIILPMDSGGVDPGTEVEVELI